MHIKCHFSDEAAETLLIGASCAGVGAELPALPAGREMSDKRRVLLADSKLALSTGDAEPGGSASPPPDDPERSSPGNGDGRAPRSPRDGAGTRISASLHPEHLQHSSPAHSHRGCGSFHFIKVRGSL